MSRLRARAVGVLTVAAGVGCAGLMSCGDDRSPQAYCESFYTHAAPVRKVFVEMNARGVDADPLGAIVNVVSAPSELAIVFDAMADHADDEIKSDTEALRDGLRDAQKNMGDPLRGLLEGGVLAMTNAAPFARVSAYLNEHCPSPTSEQAQAWIEEAGGAGS